MGTTTRVDQATLDQLRALQAHNEVVKTYARIFTPALLLFFCGITKCVFKPWDLKRVSVNSLVDSSSSSRSCSSEEKKGDESDEISSLQDYVAAATQHFDAIASHGRGGATPQQEAPSSPGSAAAAAAGGDDDDTCKVEEIWKPYNLCVDLAPPYSGRLSCLKHLTRCCSPDAAHRLVKSGLSATFHQLYTKESLKLHDISHFFTKNDDLSRWKVLTSARGLRTIAAATLLGAIALFYGGDGDGGDVWNPTDVTVTYALLWSALLMEYVLPTVIHQTFGWIERLFTGGRRTWPDQVAQYNLIGYVARSRKHSWLLTVAGWLGCRDMVDQLWTMKPCKGEFITGIVHGHVAGGWTEGYIAGADSFRAFNDYRGQWTLGGRDVVAGVGRRSSSVPSVALMSVSTPPFDESVLVWHLATVFCFHLRQAPSASAAAPAARRRCREMSNYMAYLLFVKPEMLMPGARRSLFRDACGELVGLLLDEDRRRHAAGHAPLQGRGKRDLAHKVVQLLKNKKDAGDGTQGSAGGGGFVRQAWSVAEELMDSHGGSGEEEEKMWSVIEGVWVEMLCFSASRCKGYLHAKSLGTGGEYLSYVWLLLLYMGMETLAEKMQRTELYDGGGSTAAAAITDQNV